MKKAQTEDRKLKLSKEILRTLAASELVAVGGGLITVISGALSSPYDAPKIDGGRTRG